MNYTNEQTALIKKANDENLIIVYSTTWCGPCKMMAPMIEKAAETINIIKVDIDECENLTKDAEIRAVPTVVHYKKGVEISREVGSRSDAKLIEMYNS
jgi:thioredoxin 1